MVDISSVMSSMHSLMQSSNALEGGYTVNEISTFLINGSFGEFAKWLIMERQRHFKAHDVRRTLAELLQLI